MKSTFTTNAIILNRGDHGESDLRVDVLSRDKGRMTLVARGAKKMRSKLAAHLEPFTISDIMVVTGKGFDYAGSVTGRRFFPSIKNDLAKLYYAGLGVGVISKETKEEAGGASDYFELLSELLEKLEEDRSGRLNHELLYGLFLFKFFQIFGNLPEVDRCLSCHGKITPGDNRFDVKGGGIICGSCSRSPASTTKYPQYREKEEYSPLTISDDCIKLIKLVAETDFKDAGRFKTSKSALAQEAKDTAERFYNYNF
jgi:DNA repair protein RecO (recombination protein O)